MYTFAFMPTAAAPAHPMAHALVQYNTSPSPKERETNVYHIDAVTVASAQPLDTCARHVFWTHMFQVACVRCGSSTEKNSGSPTLPMTHWPWRCTVLLSAFCMP